MVVFGQKCFYSCKSSCFLAKVVLIGQGGFIQVKVVVFGQKCLTLHKVVVCGQRLLFSGKVFVFE